MSKTSIARVWYAAIAVQVLIAISIRGVLSWQDINGEFSTPIGRVVNMFCYFTIQSNILVGVVALLLAINTKRDSTRFFVAQLTGLVCVLVAGVVYHILLASEEHLEGLTVLTNFVVHTSAPIMFTLGWLFFNDHGRTTWRIVRLSLLFPIGWAIFAMIRGAIIHYYPYPFMDVVDLGYATALINMGVVTVFFIALFVGVHLLDRKIANLIGFKV